VTAETDRMVDPGPRRRRDLVVRGCGTVREDHSADGEAWERIPHARARSRAYRPERGWAGPLV